MGCIYHALLLNLGDPRGRQDRVIVRSQTSGYLQGNGIFCIQSGRQKYKVTESMTACKDLHKLKPDKLPTWMMGSKNKLQVHSMNLLFTIDSYWKKNITFFQCSNNGKNHQKSRLDPILRSSQPTQIGQHVFICFKRRKEYEV